MENFKLALINITWSNEQLRGYAEGSDNIKFACLFVCYTFLYLFTYLFVFYHWSFQEYQEHFCALKHDIAQTLQEMRSLIQK